MNLTQLIVLGVLALAGVALAVFLVRKQNEILAEKASWVDLPGAPMKFKSVAVSPRDPSVAFWEVVRALEQVPLFKGRVFNALKGKRLLVRAEEEWDHYGTPVNGNLSEDFNTIVVGPSLAAFAHEAAHIVELALSGTTDYDLGPKGHPSWVAEIYPALSLYNKAYPLPKVSA